MNFNMKHTLNALLFILWIIHAIKADCGSPPTIPHSSNNASSHTHPYPPNHVIVYRCDNLYLPSGNPVFVCRNGAWANPGRSFNCRPRECQFIEVEHGRVVVESYVVGSIARTECDPGYELHGPQAMICLSDSNWSDPPTCEVIYCEELPHVDHLIRFQANEDGEFNDYASVVTSRCENGYQLIGDSFSECQADGTWSGEPAHCERINCGSPFVGGGYVTSLTDTYYGNVATVQCGAGYKLVGEDTWYCGQDGWVGGYCASDCVVGHIDHGVSGTTELQDGQNLFWECSPNFVHHPGNGDSVCSNGSLIPQPECREIQFGPAECPHQTPGVKVARRGNTCYVVINSKMGYETARAQCRDGYGGRLLTIRNSTVMGYIATVLNSLGWATDCSCTGCCGFFFSPHSENKFWIGLYYTDTWRWPALGEPLTYSRWKDGEGGTWWLSGQKHEECATITGGYSWQWDDVKCSDSNYVVCETYALE